MSDRVRTSVLLSVLLGLALSAACGGSGGGSSQACAEGTMSSAPCTSAADQMCAASGGTPVSICAGGQWSACSCPSSTTGAATGAPGSAAGPAMASVCGNGVAEADEQCDGMDLKQMTCATLGMGSATALLRCNPRCMFDTLLCVVASSSQGGTGAAQGGTGAMATGTAGSGGSGR